VLRVEPFTMTSLDRRASLLGAIDHVVRHASPATSSSAASGAAAA
jgi:hypothetical protein